MNRRGRGGVEEFMTSVCGDAPPGTLGSPAVHVSSCLGWRGEGWVVSVLPAAHLTCAHPCPCRQPNTEGIWELVTGGVFYCLGMVFFKSDGRIPFAHAIWHLFVAFGAGTHYYAIWRYLYLPSALQAKVSK